MSQTYLLKSFSSYQKKKNWKRKEQKKNAETELCAEAHHLLCIDYRFENVGWLMWLGEAEMVAS